MQVSKTLYYAKSVTYNIENRIQHQRSDGFYELEDIFFYEHFKPIIRAVVVFARFGWNEKKS
jgi:hypothetical protein